MAAKQAKSMSHVCVNIRIFNMEGKAMELTVVKNGFVKPFLLMAIIVVCFSCKNNGDKNGSPIETTKPIHANKYAESWGGPPRWAYADVSKDIKISVPLEDSSRRVPDSNLVLPYAKVHDIFYTPDWHPDDHQQMPPIVAVGRKPDIFACGFCHRANGAGGPENSSVDGLSIGYMKQQIADFKSGARKSAMPSRKPVEAMVLFSHDLTLDEIDTSTKYFSALRPFKNIQVIEAEQVPLTFERGWHMAVLDANKFEPIGKRIIEVPSDIDRFVSRDSRVNFIAYVPVGSIARGKELATLSTDSPACSTCHGEGLKGMGDIPRLAGRSPTYLVRQLYDFQKGFRAGPASEVMTVVSQSLSSEDIIALAAYMASLKP